MIYAFSEEQKKEIEKSGVMVIEVNLAEKMDDVFDKVSFVIEEFCNKYEKKTSRRYQVVKLLSKCTGIEKLCIWNMNRHTFLARSCC